MSGEELPAEELQPAEPDAEEPTPEALLDEEQRAGEPGSEGPAESEAERSPVD